MLCISGVKGETVASFVRMPEEGKGNLRHSQSHRMEKHSDFLNAYGDGEKTELNMASRSSEPFIDGLAPQEHKCDIPSLAQKNTCG